MKTPAHTWRTRLACKSDSSDIEQFFLLLISDINLNKLHLQIIIIIFNDMRHSVRKFLVESHIQFNYLLMLVNISDSVIASKHCANFVKHMNLAVA